MTESLYFQLLVLSLFCKDSTFQVVKESTDSVIFQSSNEKVRATRAARQRRLERIQTMPNIKVDITGSSGTGDKNGNIHEKTGTAIAPDEKGKKDRKKERAEADPTPKILTDGELKTKKSESPLIVRRPDITKRRFSADSIFDLKATHGHVAGKQQQQQTPVPNIHDLFRQSVAECEQEFSFRRHITSPILEEEEEDCSNLATYYV